MAVVEDSFSYIQLGRKNRKKKELCNKRPSQKKTIHVNQQLFSNMIHICIRPCHAEQCMHYSKHQDKSQVWLSKFQKTLARLFFSYDCDLLLLLYCTIVSLLMAFSFCHCQLLYLKSIQLWTIYEHYEAFLFLHRFLPIQASFYPQKIKCILLTTLDSFSHIPLYSYYQYSLLCIFNLRMHFLH